MADRTLKVKVPHMTGKDVELAQQTANAQMKTWKVAYRVKVDGDWGVASRDIWATVLFGLGIGQEEMADGVTPELRVKVRNKQLSKAERARYQLRAGWRRKLAKKHAGGGAAAILVKIHTHSNGFSGGHDGVDLMTTANAQAYALCACEVVRISDNWWGIANPGGSLGDQGDGIVIVRALADTGPYIKKGDYFGYGHGERPDVKVGQHLAAGARVCDAGNANGWHLHAMQYRGNPGTAGDGGPKGVGNRDPWPAIQWCIRNSH